jgi:hypothetical protein
MPTILTPKPPENGIVVAAPPATADVAPTSKPSPMDTVAPLTR